MNTISPRRIATHSPRNPLGLPCLIPSVVSALFLATLVFLSGCTITATDRAAKALGTTVTTVDVAMQGYGVAVALDRVPADDQAKLLKIYADYQAAVALAETAITNAIKSGDAGSLAAATAALDASKFQLLAFLARFNTSPP